MSSSKGKAKADKIALQKSNKAALKVQFPRAKLLKQFKAMAEATGSEAEAAELKRQTAFIVCESAMEYRLAAHGKGAGQTTDVSTIMDAWREHWKTLIIDLHKAESPFVELGEANKKGEQKPVMTGYGRNVASQARGVIEFDISVTDENGENRPYTDMTKEITKARREALPAEKRTVNAAKDALGEAMTLLRKKLGNDADSMALFTSVVSFTIETIETHGPDGLAALCLALDDIDLEEYFSDDTEAEEGEAEKTVIAEEGEAELPGLPVQIAAA
ncbi:MAG: hypothetical protein ACYSW3_25290 [Planctomycetota bacterium]|jgi:hypothetical protein